MSEVAFHQEAIQLVSQCVLLVLSQSNTNDRREKSVNTVVHLADLLGYLLDADGHAIVLVQVLVLVEAEQNRLNELIDKSQDECSHPVADHNRVVVNNSALKGGALWLSFRLFHFPASSRCPKAARTLSRLNRWLPTAFQYFRGIDLQILNHNRAVALGIAVAKLVAEVQVVKRYIQEQAGDGGQKSCGIPDEELVTLLESTNTEGSGSSPP